jgi:hypothetical protein
MKRNYKRTDELDDEGGSSIYNFFMSTSRWNEIYNSLFHSAMHYGIIFWGNSSHSSAIFKMKRVIRIIMECGFRESCRELFKELKILPLSSQCMFSLLLFVVNNSD